MKFTQQFQKTDTLASDITSGATSLTLTSGNFGSPTGKQLLVIDYDVTAKREVLLCTIAGTAVTAITRGRDGTTGVAHTAGANIIMAHVPSHYLILADAVDSGWVEEATNETWVYASASTFTIASVDVTAKYTAGTRLRFKQGGGFKYAVVVSSSFSTNTTVTIAVNTDYVIANAAITDNAYSYMVNPQGYPHLFAYTPTLVNFTIGTGGAAANTGYFSMIGKSVHGYAKAVLGTSGQSVGSDATFSLPVTASSSIPTNAMIAMGKIEDSGTGNFDAQAWLNSTTTALILFMGAGATYTTLAGTTSTTPMTWAAGDNFVMSFSYEAA